MTCEICGRDFQATRVKVVATGVYELMNDYGGIVGRAKRREDNEGDDAWCVACDPAEVTK